MKVRTNLIRVLLLFLGLSTAGCAISREDEIKMGEQAAPRFEKEFGGLYPSSRVQTYVDRVGHQLAAQTDRKDLPWRYRVVNSDQINAFALPGGFLYITKGLLFNLDNEAQLASIMGHETGHVAKKHTVKQIERQQFFSGGAMLAGIFGGSTIGSVTELASGLVLMKYSRSQEEEADLAGLKYMTAAGYNPAGIVQAMEKLQSLSSGKNPPEFLSSHPLTKNRIAYLQKTIEKEYAQFAAQGKLGQEEFAQNVLSEAAQERAITASDGKAKRAR